MQNIWTTKAIEVSAADAWSLLSNPQYWPTWGPSVRSVELDGGLIEKGATGTLTTTLGPRLRFEITSYDEGSRWAWKIAGVEATDHRVKPLTEGRCQVGFGVPWIAAPYLAVCQIALKRIRTMAEEPEVTQ